MAEDMYDDLIDKIISAPPDKVITVPISDLHPFPNHPFKVNRDEALTELAASIKEFGVMTPALVRPRKEGGYETISGHRRKAACALADVYEIPVIVRELDDDASIIAMTDSNMQRENLLPMEKAYAYKMRLEAIKHQGQASRQVGAKSRSDDTLAESSSDSARTIQRYIRLTSLIFPLQEMVDNKRIAFNPAVELSYLAEKGQNELLDVIQREDCTPSLTQAAQLKKLSQDGKLDSRTISAAIGELKANQTPKVTIRYSAVQKYYPDGTTPNEIEADFLKLLEERHKRRERSKSQER